MPEVRAASNASNMGKNKGGAYQDRDKPAQIRFSNISAAKGRPKYIYCIYCVKRLVSGPKAHHQLNSSGFGWAGLGTVIHCHQSLPLPKTNSVKCHFNTSIR